MVAERWREDSGLPYPLALSTTRKLILWRPDTTKKATVEATVMTNRQQDPFLTYQIYSTYLNLSKSPTFSNGLPVHRYSVGFRSSVFGNKIRDFFERTNSKLTCGNHTFKATMLGIPQDAWTEPFTSGRIAPMNPLDPTFIPCTVLTPSRSDIPLVQDVQNGVLGQQITYLLILRAS